MNNDPILLYLYICIQFYFLQIRNKFHKKVNSCPFFSLLQHSFSTVAFVSIENHNHKQRHWCETFIIFSQMKLRACSKYLPGLYHLHIMILLPKSLLQTMLLNESAIKCIIYLPQILYFFLLLYWPYTQ